MQHLLKMSKGTEKKSPEKGILLYGLHPVLEALRQKKRSIYQLYYSRTPTGASRLREVLKVAERNSIRITETTGARLSQWVSEDAHQGVVLRCGPLPAVADPEGLDNGGENPLWLALDQLEDPQNLGAIIRTCGFFHVTAIVIPKHHSCKITPAVSKVSAGVAEWFPVIQVTNLNRFLLQKKDRGFWIVGLDRSASREISTLRKDRPLILVLGNEGQGLRPLTRRSCDWLISIAGNPAVESLNVSNAAAIALHKLQSSSTTLNHVEADSSFAG